MTYNGLDLLLTKIITFHMNNKKITPHPPRIVPRLLNFVNFHNNYLDTYSVALKSYIRISNVSSLGITSNQKKARLISFVFFICLQIGQICYSQPVVVKKNNFNHDGSVDTKDWIFSVFEDDEGSFISAGYATKIIAGGANALRPSLVKVDKDLEDVWHQNIDACWNPVGILRSINDGGPHSFVGQMNDAIQYTDPNDGIQYYVAVGHSYFKNAPTNLLIVVKTTRDGAIVPTFPRVYMNTPGNNFDTAFANQTRHGRSIVYTKSGETGFFYIAGQENNKPCIFRLNEDLSFGSLEKIETLPNTLNADRPNLGELLSITFQYPDGADPKGNPNLPNEEPTYVWATGLGRNLVVDPQFKDSCILITKVKISGLSPFTIDQTWYENSPTPPSFPLDNWEIGGGDWGAHSGDPWYDFRKDIGKSTCLATYRQRSGGDLGTGIRQLYNGNMIVTGKANLIFSGYGGNYVPKLCLPANADYWRDCDIFARIIDADNFPTTGLPSVGGYEIASKHIGHASGMEYFPQVRQNSDGDLYFMASNGDTGTVKTHTGSGMDLLTNFHVIKTDINLNVLWSETFRS